jgi:hypothetical protein
LPHGRHSLNDDWLGSNYKRYSVWLDRNYIIIIMTNIIPIHPT